MRYPLYRQIMGTGGFDFYENQTVITLEDKIQLTTASAPPLRENLVAQIEINTSDRFFPALARQVVLASTHLAQFL